MVARPLRHRAALHALITILGIVVVLIIKATWIMFKVVILTAVFLTVGMLALVTVGLLTTET